MSVEKMIAGFKELAESCQRRRKTDLELVEEAISGLGFRERNRMKLQMLMLIEYARIDERRKLFDEFGMPRQFEEG